MGKVPGMLNAAGYRTGSGARWTEKTVRDIVVSEVYTGKVKYSGQYAPGAHTPIIDAETFQAAQAVRMARDRVGGRSPGSPFLLSGLVRCKGCGHLMYTQPATERRWRRRGAECRSSRPGPQGMWAKHRVRSDSHNY